MITNLKFENQLTSNSTSIIDRILDTFPSGSYALSALLRLLDIVETTSVPTAAVECKAQPRLLINPEFVEKHAQTSEKLLSLVMHELHHVLLGHTTLFPRTTKVQNFVFDAVINGIICRMFPEEDYTSFFTDFYDADAFPECLLRPPKGWLKSVNNKPLSSKLVLVDKSAIPGTLDALPEETRVLVNEVHAALYSGSGASYQEVYKLLPKLIGKNLLDGIPLIGGHEEVSDGQLEIRSPVLFDIVRGLVEQWPQPPDPIRGRSLSDIINTNTIQPKRKLTNRSILRNLICKVADNKHAGSIKRIRLDKIEVTTPIPVLNRRTVVQRALGTEPLLFTGTSSFSLRVNSGKRVHIYLDVSGSMDAVKSALYGAVIDCAAFVHPVIHLFSSKVADISMDQLRRGVCKTTGGTCITCVAEHMSVNAVHRAVIITDGWVGKPNGSHKTTLDTAKLAVAYLGDSTNNQDLANVANHTAILFIGDIK